MYLNSNSFSACYSLLFSLRIIPAKSHKIILSAWYYPVRLVSFCPQNLDGTARKSTKYTSFPGSGTLGDKIFHRVVREKFLELTVELRRQGLVVSDDQRGFIQLRNDIRHGKRLARSGNAKEGLTLVAFLEAFDQVSDSLGLVAGWFIF